MNRADTRFAGVPAASSPTGFTLIEVVIAVAIIGIIVAVAIPSYEKHVQRTRRVDAISYLQLAAGEQRKYFTENNRFATGLDELNLSATPDGESDAGHYTITVSNPTAASFVLTATPVAGGLQENDTECGTLTLSSTGAKGAAGSSGVPGCW